MAGALESLVGIRLALVVVACLMLVGVAIAWTSPLRTRPVPLG